MGPATSRTLAPTTPRRALAQVPTMACDVACSHDQQPNFDTCECEPTQNCSFVEELYLTILCRPGKARGIGFYKRKCAEGMDESRMETIFRNSDEYQACAKCQNNCSTTAPATSRTLAPTTPRRALAQVPTMACDMACSHDQQPNFDTCECEPTQNCSFVEELYLTILCRPGKAHGIEFYKGECAKGIDQSRMERIFRNSPEYQACAKCKNNCSTTAPATSRTLAPTTPTRAPTQVPTIACDLACSHDQQPNFDTCECEPTQNCSFVEE